MIVNTNPAVINSPRIAWNNLLADAVLTSTGSNPNFPITNLLNNYTNDPWIPDAVPASLFITFASARSISMACFAGHNMGGREVTVLFQHFIAGDWETIASATPTDNDTLILSFPAVSATQFRVRFLGVNTFRLGVLFVVPGLTIPGIIVPPHTPLNRVSEIELIGGAEGVTGEFLQSDFMRTGGRASLTMSAQSPSFATGSTFETFRDHFNRGRPFFIACFPTHNPDDVGFCWRNGGNLIVAYSDPVYMAMAMDVGVYVVR